VVPYTVFFSTNQPLSIQIVDPNNPNSPEIVSLGDLFCISGSCDLIFDISGLKSLVSVSSVWVSTSSFSPFAEDVEASDPPVTDQYISRTTSVPDAGEVFVNGPMDAAFASLSVPPMWLTLSIALLSLVGLQRPPFQQYVGSRARSSNDPRCDGDGLAKLYTDFRGEELVSSFAAHATAPMHEGSDHFCFCRASVDIP